MQRCEMGRDLLDDAKFAARRRFGLVGRRLAILRRVRRAVLVGWRRCEDWQYAYRLQCGRCGHSGALCCRLLWRAFSMEKQATAIFSRKYTLNCVNRDGYFTRNTVKAGRKLNQFITDGEIARGLLAHGKYNFTVLHVFQWYAGVLIHLDVKERRKT